MERNDANDFGTAGNTGSGSTGGTTGSSGSGLGAGGTSGTTGGAGGYGGSSLGGSTGSTGGYGDTAGGSYGSATGTPGSATGTPLLEDGSESRADHLKGTVKDQAAVAREKLGQAGERAREMKRTAEQTLADRLEAGANRLRERGASGASAGTPAYAAAGGATTDAATSGQLDNLQGNVVKGMEATADWLRNGDLKSTVEEQARTNPGRTLLVALGVGYLLGKALRR